MSEEIDSTNNISTTTYDKLKEEVRAKIKVSGKDYIPKLYEALRQDGYDPDQAREKIERDFLNVWSKKWIKENVPEEAIHTEKRNKEKDAEVISAYEDKKVIEVTTTGRQETNKHIGPPKPLVSPTTRFIPLPTTEEKPRTKKLKLDFELDVNGQIVPLLATVFIDWDKQIVEADNIQVQNS